MFRSGGYAIRRWEQANSENRGDTTVRDTLMDLRACRREHSRRRGCDTGWGVLRRGATATFARRPCPPRAYYRDVGANFPGLAGWRGRLVWFRALEAKAPPALLAGMHRTLEADDWQTPGREALLSPRGLRRPQGTIAMAVPSTSQRARPLLATATGIAA